MTSFVEQFEATVQKFTFKLAGNGTDSDHAARLWSRCITLRQVLDREPTLAAIRGVGVLSADGKSLDEEVTGYTSDALILLTLLSQMNIDVTTLTFEPVYPGDGDTPLTDTYGRDVFGR